MNFYLLWLGKGKKNVADKYHKGSVRSFIDAKNLNVIDRRVASLVEVMNYPNLISTVGSCEGHGFSNEQ